MLIVVLAVIVTAAAACGKSKKPDVTTAVTTTTAPAVTTTAPVATTTAPAVTTTAPVVTTTAPVVTTTVPVVTTTAPVVTTTAPVVTTTTPAVTTTKPVVTTTAPQVPDTPYIPNVYTVTFLDHDGKLLSSQTVIEGNSATAPEAPNRRCYVFTGWDVSFNYVYSNLVVTAQYEKVDPSLIVNSVTASAGDQNVEVLITIENNSGLLGGEFKIYFAEGLTLVSASSGEAFAELTYQKPSSYRNGSVFLWYGAEITEAKDAGVLTLVFNISESATAGDYAIEIHVDGDSFYDTDVAPVSIDIENGKISVN